MIRAALLACFAAGSAHALTLELPAGAELTRDVTRDGGSRVIPTAPTRDGFTATRLAQGNVTIQSYRAPDRRDTAGLMAPLATQLGQAGYATILSCAGVTCGGFDFRFALNLIPPPDMFVDLSDYHYLSAEHADGSYATVLTSRSHSDGYIHIVQVAAPNSAPPVIAAPTPDPARAIRSFADELMELGHVALDDLEFQSGSSELADQGYTSLTALAEFLAANPTLRVVLVGHTDASGALDVNVRISRERAGSARAQLLALYKIRPEQVTAEGMGYLAPRDTNLTPEGRDRNRRVEVILLPGDR
ncbi:MAG: OmpA family protein [Pseudomonadota bacterium]